jgi:uncharacterized protein (DUF2267 family)
MEELVKMVSEQTGIPKEKAEQAVEIVLDYLRKKLPPGIAKQIDAALANEELMDNVADRAKDLLGGLGKK